MRLRILYSITLLITSAAIVNAQDLPIPTAASPRTEVVPMPPTAPFLTRVDTARAVHELFRSRRGGGFGWLALGTAGMLASILPAQQSTSAGVWTPGVVAGSALVGIGLNKRIQFRRSREKRILRELAATGHLPASISRRLKGNFMPLHGTDSEENPLLAKGIMPGGVMPSIASTTPEQKFSDARQDTLDAVQGLFNAKRLGGQLPILLALPGLRLMTGSTASNSAAPSYVQSNKEPSGGQVAAGLLLAAGGVVYMFVHNAPYSNVKFAELRANYLSGAPLPSAIRAQLKEKHIASGRAYRVRMERNAARRR